VAKTLSNIALTYFKTLDYEKGFEFLAKGISSSSSLEEFNNIIHLLLRTIRRMVISNEWENLEKISVVYTSGIIADKILLNFFTSIYEYAMYRNTGDESHKKKYEAAGQELDFAYAKLLDELLEVKK